MNLFFCWTTYRCVEQFVYEHTKLENEHMFGTQSLCSGINIDQPLQATLHRFILPAISAAYI